MAKKSYSEKELAEIGRKVIASREQQAETAKARRKVQSKLYQMYKNGEIKVNV